jgi:hypothetical protein
MPKGLAVAMAGSGCWEADWTRMQLNRRHRGSGLLKGMKGKCIDGSDMD